MIEQPQKSQPVNFAFGIIFGMLAGVAVYGVTQWPPAIALGASFGLVVGIFVSVIQSRQK
jgi:hypothetical protein